MLERDPELVMTDLQLGQISERVARDIYRVAWEQETFVVDEEATKKMREDERQARLKRGKPYSEFVEEFVKEEPPEDLAYYGSWGQDNDEQLIATVWGHNGAERVQGTISEMPIINVPNRHVVKIDKLEARIRELEEKHGEVSHHKA